MSDSRDVALGLAVVGAEVGMAAGRAILAPMRLVARAPLVAGVAHRVAEAELAVFVAGHTGNGSFMNMGTRRASTRGGVVTDETLVVLLATRTAFTRAPVSTWRPTR